MKHTIARMLASLALLGMLAGVLFPFGLLEGPRRIIYEDIGGINPVLTHLIGHALIFAGLGLALLAAAPRLRSQPWAYLGLILLAAIGQELLQKTFKQNGLTLDDLVDIMVDSVAAALVFWGSALRARWGRMDDCHTRERGHL